jgi:hypothetical protein
VGERGGDQPGDVHPTYPCRTLPAEQRALLAQSFGDDQAEQSSDDRRLGYIGPGRAQNDGGSLRLGGGKRARNHVEGDGHSDTVTAPLEGADGTAAGST